MKIRKAILLLLFVATVVFGGAYFAGYRSIVDSDVSKVVETADSVNNLVAESMTSIFSRNIEFKDPHLHRTLRE